MVSALLIAAALAAAPSPTDGAASARAEARVTATIRHAVTLRGNTATARDASAPARPLPPRRCDPADTDSDCRLIVFDLP